ncbi:unnamed protein product [Pleuronectes platessa]|uniref:Uncharacterized protein n=1 Tax=Pleuronectes platessa TaxID=8262 RepID=A0A9N7W3A1_PLEPL|nr:unnamed protein product [Pleuronectes platessa]
MTSRPVYGCVRASPTEPVCLPATKSILPCGELCFPAGALVSPSVALRLGSHHNRRPTAVRRKTGVTLRAAGMFRWLTSVLGEPSRSVSSRPKQRGLLGAKSSRYPGRSGVLSVCPGQDH